MSLNKRRGNMYPWVTHTWNPIKGCKHACRYCYVKDLEARYQYNTSPRFIENELKTNLGNDNVIFVGSTSDMWGEWISSVHIKEVLKRCREFDNTYVFQSKAPERFLEFLDLGIFPEKSILGTTIETDRYVERITEAPNISNRVRTMTRIKGKSIGDGSQIV
jgi:DNA repair photolyase